MNKLNQEHKLVDKYRLIHWLNIRKTTVIATEFSFPIRIKNHTTIFTRFLCIIWSFCT